MGKLDKFKSMRKPEPKPKAKPRIGYFHIAVPWVEGACAAARSANQLLILMRLYRQRMIDLRNGRHTLTTQRSLCDDNMSRHPKDDAIAAAVKAGLIRLERETNGQAWRVTVRGLDYHAPKSEPAPENGGPGAPGAGTCT